MEENARVFGGERKISMKAYIWNADGTARLADRPMPEILEPRDAIVRVRLSTICTSDLHILHGAVPRAVPVAEAMLAYGLLDRLVSEGRLDG